MATLTTGRSAHDLVGDRCSAAASWTLASTRRSCVFVFLVTLTVYLLTARYVAGIQIDDTSAAVFPAWNFVHHGSFMLDHVEHLPRNVWFWHVNGHLISWRMMGALLTAVPICALLSWTHISPGELNAINAAFMAALTITALSGTFRRIAPARVAMASTLVLAFGTSLWTVGAAQTWPQTSDALWLSLMLLALSHQRIWLAGFVLLPALITRPHVAFASLLVGVGLSIRMRSIRPALAFGTPPLLAAGLLFLWNHWYFGQWNLLGAYQSHTGSITDGSIGGVPYGEGVLATFFSPTIGLFVFTPIAALAVFWTVRMRRHVPAWSALALAGGILYEIVQLKVDIFTGGGGFFGGRLIIELVVLASPALVACYAPWSQGHFSRRLLATVLSMVSIATFVIGARLQWSVVDLSKGVTWTTYFPLQVVRVAGLNGTTTAVSVLVLALVFVLARATWLRSTDGAHIVKPREASDDERVREPQLQ